MNKKSRVEQKAVTMEDVARHVGVTRMTVSRVLNGTGRISPAMRTAVQESMRVLNYQPNLHAQRLSTGRCPNLVSLFSLYLDHGGSARRVELIQRALNDKGFDAPLHAYGCFNQNRPVNQGQLLSDLRRQRPLAIVCFTAGLDDAALQELTRFQQEGGFVVCYDEPADIPCDQVIVDWSISSSLAIMHLMELGHRHIGFYKMGTPDPVSFYTHGFRNAMARHGLDVREEWIFSGGMHGEGGAAAAEHFMTLKERPTAMCFSEELSAAGFISEVQRGGYTVPRDVSIISMTDLLIARYLSIPLTTVATPAEAVAESVVELLCSRIEGNYDGPAQTSVIHGMVTIRSSTACLQL